MPWGITPSELVGWLATAGGIIIVDLALSGDNALIIGAAASRLPRGQQLTALLWGGAGAIVARIVLTTIAAGLLLLPYVQTAGAVLIMIITIQLLLPEREREKEERAEAAAVERAVEDVEGAVKRAKPARRGNGSGAPDRLGPAILTILVADVSMSLDNVLAIGAISHGDFVLLAFGLLLSMALLLTASAIIARMIARMPWLMDLTALILAYTAASLALHDPALGRLVNVTGALAAEVTIGLLAFTVLVDIGFRVARARATRAAHTRLAASASAGTPADDTGGAAKDGGDMSAMTTNATPTRPANGETPGT